MAEIFDYKTARIIIENNLGFIRMRESRIFTFEKNCYEWDGKNIIDGCDEYYNEELTKDLCLQLSKGFAELSFCFKTAEEKELGKMRLIDANSVSYCNYDLDNYHSFCAVTKEEIDEMPTILWL